MTGLPAAATRCCSSASERTLWNPTFEPASGELGVAAVRSPASGCRMVASPGQRTDQQRIPKQKGKDTDAFPQLAKTRSVRPATGLSHAGKSQTRP
jgi:hypothetical protein